MGEIGKLIASAEDGLLRKEGIRTVIVGKPNAGKSSLLNLLVGEEQRDCNGYRRHDARCAGGIHPVKGNQFEYH